MTPFLRRAVSLIAMAVLFVGPARASDRGITVASSNGALPTDTWGTYHALIIGINDYQQWPQLRTAVKDATVLSQVLVDRYGFDKERVILRTDTAATRRQITADIRALATSMKPEDNLLVYYAGHGQLDKLTGDGYWIPVEGEANNPSSWIANSYLKAVFSSEMVTAKNVVVIADSCYSGAMLRGGPDPMSMDGDYKTKLRQAAAKRSRQVISSGGIEPVADGGAEGHSLFAFYFITALKENDREVIDLENLFHTRVWKPVSEIGGQRPSVGRLKTPMDRDGQFVLYNQAWAEQQRRAEENRRREADRRAEEAATRKQKAVAADQMAAIQAEKQRIEIERQKLAMEKELMAQRQALELDKLKLERQKLAMEKEKVARETVPAAPLVAALPPTSLDRPPIDAGRRSVVLFPVLREIRVAGWGQPHSSMKGAIEGVAEAVGRSGHYAFSHVFEEDDSERTKHAIIIDSDDFKQELSVLWEKKSFFDTFKSPQMKIAMELGKKFNTDFAMLLNVVANADDLSVNLYLIDIRSGTVVTKTVKDHMSINWIEKMRIVTSEAIKEMDTSLIGAAQTRYNCLISFQRATP